MYTILCWLIDEIFVWSYKLQPSGIPVETYRRRKLGVHPNNQQMICDRI